MNLADSAGILEVFRLLTRQRSVVTYGGSEFRTVLSRLAFLEQQVLMELVQEGRPPGHLLMQRGWVVFAQQGVLTGQAAADQLAAGAARSTLRLFALGIAPAALAFASVDGMAAEPGTGEYSSLSARMTALSQRQFSGVVAVRARESVNVWQMQAGRVTAQQELLRPETFGPFVELAWNDHDLPRLSLGADGMDADGLQSEAGSDLPPAPGPVTPGAPRTSQGVEGGTGNSAPRNSGTGNSSTGNSSTGNADLVWTHFRRVLDAHLGEAGLRLYSVVRSQHAQTGGLALCEALGLHVERVGGRSAGLEFRRHVAPVLTSLAPVPIPLEESL